MVGRTHIPERRCLGCGARAPKPSLRRFVAMPGPDGHQLVRDVTGRHGGRGLYVCEDRACFDRALEHRGFHRGARLAGGSLTVDPSLAEDVGR